MCLWCRIIISGNTGITLNFTVSDLSYEGFGKDLEMLHSIGVVSCFDFDETDIDKKVDKNHMRGVKDIELIGDSVTPLVNNNYNINNNNNDDNSANGANNKKRKADINEDRYEEGVLVLSAVEEMVKNMLSEVQMLKARLLLRMQEIREEEEKTLLTISTSSTITTTATTHK